MESIVGIVDDVEAADRLASALIAEVPRAPVRTSRRPARSVVPTVNCACTPR
jgi:hypothetical protein